MTKGFLRMVAVLVLLVAGATFSFCPSVVASLAEPQAVDHCCSHGQGEEAPAAPGGDCSGTECGCVTCLVVILPTAEVRLSSRTVGETHPLLDQQSPPAEYLARIDYPPEHA